WVAVLSYGGARRNCRTSRIRSKALDAGVLNLRGDLRCGHDLPGYLLSSAYQLHLARFSDRLFRQQAMQVIHSGDRVAFEANDHVVLTHARRLRRTVRFYGQYQQTCTGLQVVIAHKLAMHWHVLPSEPQVATADSAVLYQT